MPVDALLEAIGQRYGTSVVAVLIYGSCMRSNDPFDGLVDLYVLVDDYTKAYQNRWLSWSNRLLPPNVFYLETGHSGSRLRAKYALLSVRDFERGVRWFHSYLWGRFAQPCRMIYWQQSPDGLAQCRRKYSTVVDFVASSLLTAADTFVSQTVPMLAPCFTLRELWTTGLKLSYGAELRAEMGESRANQLYDYAEDYYQELTVPLLEQLPYTLEIDSNGHFCLDIPGWDRRLCRWRWRVRRLQGKVLSLARLIKALFTFQGGVDYIVWKLERHSGRPIEIPDSARRHPLIFGWGVLWRLYRQGVFR